MALYNYTREDVHVKVAVNSAPISNSYPTRGVLRLVQVPKPGPSEDLDLGGNAKLRIRQIQGVAVEGDVAAVEMGDNLIVSSHELALALWRDGYKGEPCSGRVFVPAPTPYAAEVELYEVKKPADDQARFAEIESLRAANAESLRKIAALVGELDAEKDRRKEGESKAAMEVLALDARIKELQDLLTSQRAEFDAVISARDVTIASLEASAKPAGKATRTVKTAPTDAPASGDVPVADPAPLGDAAPAGDA